MIKFQYCAVVFLEEFSNPTMQPRLTPPTLINIDPVDPGVWYWGLQHLSHYHAPRIYRIIKTYRNENHADRQFTLDFPPTSTPITALEDKTPEGWIGRDGAFYVCRYGEHSSLAGDLLMVKYRVSADNREAEKLLRAKGWLLIRNSPMYTELPATDRQLVALQKLIHISKDVYPNYAKWIEKLIQRCQRMKIKPEVESHE